MTRDYGFHLNPVTVIFFFDCGEREGLSAHLRQMRAGVWVFHVTFQEGSLYYYLIQLGFGVGLQPWDPVWEGVVCYGSWCVLTDPVDRRGVQPLTHGDNGKVLHYSRSHKYCPNTELGWGIVTARQRWGFQVPNSPPVVAQAIRVHYHKAGTTGSLLNLWQQIGRGCWSCDIFQISLIKG